MKKLLFLIFIIILNIYSGINAVPLSIFNASNYWTQFSNNDDRYRTSNRYVNPGFGVQLFDPDRDSSPFAMQSGSLRGVLSENSSRTESTISTYLNGYYYGGFSYYGIASFPVSLIPISNKTINLTAHWTMSCSNDAINELALIQHPVLPESGTMLLIGSLTTGLCWFCWITQ